MTRWRGRGRTPSSVLTVCRTDGSSDPSQAKYGCIASNITLPVRRAVEVVLRFRRLLAVPSFHKRRCVWTSHSKMPVIG